MMDEKGGDWRDEWIRWWKGECSKWVENWVDGGKNERMTEWIAMSDVLHTKAGKGESHSMEISSRSDCKLNKIIMELERLSLQDTPVPRSSF